MGVEIERVFLLDGAPPAMPRGEVWIIEQGYLPPDPTQELAEGRVRRTVLPDGSAEHTHTVKRGTGRVREETERPISAAAFAAAWPRTEGRRICKTRTRVPHAGHTWEIDQFRDLPLVLAECELDTADERAPIPAWLQPHIVREVTEEQEYRNYQLALKAGMLRGNSG